MKRICCECGKHLGEKEGPVDVVTHGLCDPCLKKCMDEIDSQENSEKTGRETEAC